MATASARTVEFARQEASSAPGDSERLTGLLTAYYRREGNYAGATFSDLNPNDPYTFSVSELLAVTMRPGAHRFVARKGCAVRVIEPHPKCAAEDGVDAPSSAAPTT
ncbi:MAG: hypothetical protein ACRCYU_14530 [Nocardioides sp.]